MVQLKKITTGSQQQYNATQSNATHHNTLVLKAWLVNCKRLTKTHFPSGTSLLFELVFSHFDVLQLLLKLLGIAFGLQTLDLKVSQPGKQEHETDTSDM